MCCYFMANILRRNAFHCGLHMSIASKQEKKKQNTISSHTLHKDFIAELKERDLYCAPDFNFK